MLSLEDLKMKYPEVAARDKVAEYLKSEKFVENCRQRYSSKVHRRLLDRKQFTLVMAFEETIDFWEIGSHLFH